MSTIIYHNPRCSKSRATLALLSERGIDARIVDYLNEPLSVDQIQSIIAQLAGPASQLIRDREDDFAKSGLARDEEDPAAIAAAIVAFPRLLQRPVVIANGRARIGRPPENVLEIL